MTTSFDSAAATYDSSFTHSVIGKLQRGYVRSLLSEVLIRKKPQRILEVNCGTGEDAIWFAQQNFNVIATDLSEKMIDVARAKGKFDNIDFRQTDLNEIDTQFKGEQFDLVFSNFGGLNCLSEVQLELFFKNAAALLSEKGLLALVVMPKSTLWEQFYFLAKADFGSVFRRKKNGLIANVDGQSVITYYYNPKQAAELAHYYFEAETVNPVGFFVPPSYLEPFFKNKPRLIGFLDKLETKAQRQKRLSKYADHYLLVLRKR